MKRVLFLYHGGTIGLVVEKYNGHPILVPPKNSETFRIAVEPTIEKVKKDMDIDYEFVTSKDSNNVTPHDWENLILRIKKAQEEGYDSVAIVHGTDTLAYTATALALALNGKNPDISALRIPVCITGAQNSIYSLGGDARFNLENLFRTVKKAMDLEVSDVLVNFWDRILLGCRVFKTSEKKFDAFNTPSYPDVGTINSNGIYMNPNLVNRYNKYESNVVADIAPKFGKDVLSVDLSPGIDPEIVLDLVTRGKISALVLKSLGEGNVCSEGRYSMIPVIKKASEDNLPVFITTKFPGGNAVSVHYEGGFRAIQAGGIPCYDHTDVATYVKVRWLLGNGLCRNIPDFKKAMETSFVGEVTPPNN